MTDLISRNAVIGLLLRIKAHASVAVLCETISKEMEDKVVDIVDMFAEMVQKIPAIDAVPVVHAGWEDQDYTFTRFQCTACKSMNHSMMTKYCPDCGARMDSEGKEEK